MEYKTRDDMIKAGDQAGGDLETAGEWQERIEKEQQASLGLTDAEIDAALDELHGHDKDMSTVHDHVIDYEKELNQARKEAGQERAASFRKWLELDEKYCQMQAMVGIQAGQIGDAVKELDQAIVRFQEWQAREERKQLESDWPSDRALSQGYRVALGAGVAVFKMVKQGLERKVAE